MWPVQTVVNILCITWFPDPDDVIMRNEPEQLQNTSAILEVSLAPTIFATSLPMSLLPYFQMQLKSYCNSFASPLRLINRRIKLNKKDRHYLIHHENANGPRPLRRFASSRRVCSQHIYIVSMVTAELKEIEMYTLTGK